MKTTLVLILALITVLGAKAEAARLSFKDKTKTTIIAPGQLSSEELTYDDEGNDESVDMDDTTKELFGLETVLCSEESDINVRSEDLSTILYTAKNGDDIKIFQGWGDNTKTVEIEGKQYTFIKVNFIGNDGIPQIGFVLSSLVKPKTNCQFIAQEPEENPEILEKDLEISGLNDENCCTFPTVARVTRPFTEGMRRFGSGRNGGKRVHAAADLYRFINEPILSVAPGKVIRNLYYFYQGTYALEVVHSGGFIVRYGEITSKTPAGIRRNKQLRMGERLGSMGKVLGMHVEPMLHFELYKGTLNGPLTQNGIGGPDNRRYNRRDDLLNPTPYLLKWQAKQLH